MAETAGRRLGRGGVPDDDHGGGYVPASITAARPWRRMTGCPCGCMTRLPWLDDPDCIRHRPLRIIEYTGYDVAGLGLVPHDRTACPHCRAVAS